MNHQAPTNQTAAIRPSRGGSFTLRQMAFLIAAAVVAFVGTIGPAVLAAPVTVVITNSLSPKDLTVAVGTTVTWDNQDNDDHRLEFSGPRSYELDLDEGESRSITFNTLGTYQYFDDRDDNNSNYFGTVTVTESGGGGSTTTTLPPSGGYIVDMINDSFRPGSLTIAIDTTVGFRNLDGDDHTATANDGSWNTGLYATGTRDITFNTAGTFAYFCTEHGGMTGTITVTGGGGSTTTTTTTTPPPTPSLGGDVTIFDNGYTPASKTITTGTTLVWSNTGALPHTVTDTNGSFDSGFVMAGQTYARTFNTAGSYSYFCTLHPGMTGSVTVTGGGGSTPTTTVPPSTTTTTLPPTPAPPGDIDVYDNGYTPASKTITTGTTLVWSNTGALPHTVTDTNGSFDSGIFMAGQTYARTFNTPGSYSYFCTIHPAMTGTINVTGTATGQPDTGAGSTTTTVPPTPAPPGDIKMFDNGYTPSSKTITTGTTLVWSNTGALPHTVTASNGSFDSGFVMAGQTYRRTFNTPGSYPYICTLHPGMAGSITVTGTATGQPDTDTGTGGEDGPPPVSAPPGDIDVYDNGYTPASKTITTGTTLVWSNTGALPHTVTDTNGSFDSGIFMAGQTYSRTFNTPGNYSYFCTIHPAMTGTINVTGTATGQPDTGEVSDGVADTITEEGIADSDTSVEASGDTPPLSDARISADIIDLDYDPRDLTVELGTTVVWTNIGELPHTVTDINGAFDSGLMLKGDVYERRFGELGTFDYFCTLHPNMVGSVTVVEVAGSIETSEAAPAPVTLEAGSTPRGLADLSPAAGAIVGLLFVLAALLVGGFAMLGRKLLSSDSDSI